MTDPSLILVIDDEVQIQRLLKLTLEKAGYRVLTAGTGEEGTLRVRTDRPDLAILDLGLPDMDGIKVLREIRQVSELPVIILSVRSSEEDIIQALDAGADDYLTKPFRTGELLARVRASLRKTPAEAGKQVYTFGSLTVDLESRSVARGEDLIKLTATEYSLLSLFVRNAGKVLTHKYILEQVWGPAYNEETQYTRVHVGHLRKKIEKDPEHPVLIITESGIGYRFVRE
jgi:two-component system KDP operon response regulator KdpE